MLYFVVGIKKEKSVLHLLCFIEKINCQLIFIARQKKYNLKEMTVYENEVVRGENPSLIYDYLMTLKPTSVEAERSFSALY